MNLNILVETDSIMVPISSKTQICFSCVASKIHESKEITKQNKNKKIVGKSPNAAENLVFKRKVFKSTSQRIERL